MSVGIIVAIVVAALVIIIAIALVVMYNNFVQLRNRVDNAWAQIDVQLQRRLDLIPNLVETVKGYAKHENSTLNQVTEARSALMHAQAPAEKVAADNILSGALKNLFAVAENYPDLKANTNFQQLQTELANTEDKISYMRQSYNDVVMMYNNAIQTFPGVLVAGMFHFDKRESFDANEAATEAPKVSFGA
ncbi:MAG: LemA family protein [Eggerthellaceae bacterium]